MKDEFTDTAATLAFNRGYDAAKKHQANLTAKLCSRELREICTTLVGAGQFRNGWMAFCDELAATEKAKAQGDAAYQRKERNARIATWLTWAALAACIVLVGIYAWPYYTRQLDRAADQQRQLQLRDQQIRWLGSVETVRHYYRDGDMPGRPTGHLFTSPIDAEIGLRADGTVIWRKVVLKLPEPAAQNTQK